MTFVSSKKYKVGDIITNFEQNIIPIGNPSSGKYTYGVEFVNGGKEIEIKSVPKTSTVARELERLKSKSLLFGGG